MNSNRNKRLRWWFIVLTLIFFSFGTKSQLSPYDEIIRKYSKTIDWDWRLLAALIYKESNFRVDVTSPKGAMGLMQITHGTAEKFGVGIEDIYDPEINIKVGTLFLRNISRLVCDTLMEKTEQIKFMLAAYNAGPEQLRICREFASLLGRDANVWSEVADVIPLMRNAEYAHLFKRRFRGDETIRFVDEVLERYRRYCEIIK